MSATQGPLKRLEKLKNKERFIVSEVGKQKFLDTINALDKISNELKLSPSELLTITELYRLESLLPVL